MIFNNIENKCFKVIDNGKERLVWESRSVAVNGVVIVWRNGNDIPYVLVSERGPNAADFQGKMNVVAGYLDWDETGTEAFYREAWEECGLNIPKLLKETSPLDVHLDQPWHVKTNTDENRQNVSLRYGCNLLLDSIVLPPLTLDNNEVEGEVSEAFWLPVNKIDDYEWAFNHDELIKDYLKKINAYDKYLK
jgi:8-oxo-dGTP pyrophosphatase MutT (NUDIX family)